MQLLSAECVGGGGAPTQYSPASVANGGASALSASGGSFPPPDTATPMAVDLLFSSVSAYGAAAAAQLAAAPARLLRTERLGRSLAPDVASPWFAPPASPEPLDDNSPTSALAAVLLGNALAAGLGCQPSGAITPPAPAMAGYLAAFVKAGGASAALALACVPGMTSVAYLTLAPSPTPAAPSGSSGVPYGAVVGASVAAAVIVAVAVVAGWWALALRRQRSERLAAAGGKGGDSGAGGYDGDSAASLPSSTMRMMENPLQRRRRSRGADASPGTDAASHVEDPLALARARHTGERRRSASSAAYNAAGARGFGGRGFGGRGFGGRGHGAMSAASGSSVSRSAGGPRGGVGSPPRAPLMLEDGGASGLYSEGGSSVDSASSDEGSGDDHREELQHSAARDRHHSSPPGGRQHSPGRLSGSFSPTGGGGPQRDPRELPYQGQSAYLLRSRDDEYRQRTGEEYHQRAGVESSRRATGPAPAMRYGGAPYEAGPYYGSGRGGEEGEEGGYEDAAAQYGGRSPLYALQPSRSTGLLPGYSEAQRVLPVPFSPPPGSAARPPSSAVRRW